jgi:GT2 family glycosyltransferase
MNAGIRTAISHGASHVWLLNADCLPAPDALSALLAQADAYAVSASLQLSSAQPWSADATAYTSAAMLPAGRVAPVACDGCDIGHHDVDVVTGASLFAGTGWLTAVDLIDESFFHYKEEFDLVVRIGKAGGKVGFVCASRVWHERGGSLGLASPKARYYHYRNEILYIRKHYRRPLWRMAAHEPIHYKTLFAAVAGLLAGGQRRRVSQAIFAAYRDGIRGVHGPTGRF